MPKMGATLPVGVAVTGAPSAVSDGAAVRQHFDEYGKQAVMLGADGSTNFAATAQGNADGTGATLRGLLTRTFAQRYNESTWDRERGNTEITLLASAARTATLSSADQTNYNARGIIITIDVTSITDTPSITLAIQHRDSIGGNYETLFLTTTAITATGVQPFIVYPGVAAADEDVVEVVGYPLGRTWRITVTHADADSITYSVAGSYVP